MISYLFKKSCTLGPNILDWIRSLYFSVLGSSVLSLALKWKALSYLAFSSYFVAIVFFIYGLKYSVIIANRFKQLEKDYDKDTLIDKKKVHFHPDYLLMKDEKNKFQHFLLYTLWLPAICLLCYSGFYIENKSSIGSLETKNKIDKIQTKIEELNSVQQKIFDFTQTNKQLQDSLQVIRTANDNCEKQIDSLKKTIKILQPKQKSKQVQPQK